MKFFIILYAYNRPLKTASAVYSIPLLEKEEKEKEISQTP